MQRTRKIGLAVMATLIAATTMAGCGLFNEQVFSGGDLYTCILNTKTGKITREIPSGSEEGYTLGADEVDYQVPTSNRFYNITANRANADDGAPAFLTGQSAGYRAVQAQVTARFVFKQTEICDWVLRHGKRNDQADDGDLQFGARLEPDDANEPNRRAKTEWAVWLNENFAPALQKVGQPIWQRYEWENLEFNYPVNAQADGTLREGTEPGKLTWKQIEVDLGAAFTEELNAKLGGEYFCGVGYDPQSPDECPPIDIDVVDVSMTDQKPVEERAKLDTQRDEQENARQAAGIAEETLTQKRAAAEANSALRQLELLEAEEQAKVDAAKQRSNALSDPEVAKCLVLVEAVGTCPMIEEARKVPGGNITVNQTPGG